MCSKYEKNRSWLYRHRSSGMMEFCSLSKWSVFVWHFWKRSSTAVSEFLQIRPEKLRSVASLQRNAIVRERERGWRRTARILSKTGSCCRLVKNSGCTVEMVQSGQLKQRFVSSLRGGQKLPPKVPPSTSDWLQSVAPWRIQTTSVPWWIHNGQNWKYWEYWFSSSDWVNHKWNNWYNNIKISSYNN